MLSRIISRRLWQRFAEILATEVVLIADGGGIAGRCAGAGPAGTERVAAMLAREPVRVRIVDSAARKVPVRCSPAGRIHVDR
jgi:hypothetical protein